MAAEWMAGKSGPVVSKLSLSKALDEYIGAQDGILSPSTIKGYEATARMICKHEIARRNVTAITPADLQRFIKAFSRDHSPKTTHNAYGLITAVFAFLGMPAPKGINLPPVEKKAYYVPNEADMQSIMELAAGTPMEIPILLGMCGLRRSEITALTTDDIDHEHHGIYVHSAIVEDQHRELVRKGTKTKSSTRLVLLPDFLYAKLDALEPGPVTHLTPKAITCRWEKLRKKAGIESRFHDLRHFSVSVAHYLGVKDQYIMARHGFKTDYTMKRVYRNEIDLHEMEANNVINSYYDGLFNH